MVFKINEIIAENLVSRLALVLDNKIIVADMQGDVLSSSDLSETSKNYEQLRECAESGKEMRISGSFQGSTLASGLALPIKFGGEVSGSVFIEDPDAKLEHHKKILLMAVELLTQQYLMTGNLPYKDKIKDNFVYGFLHRKLNLEDSKTREESELFDINLTRDKVVVVVKPIGFWQNLFLDKPSASEDEKQTAISTFKKYLFMSVSSFFGRLSGCTVSYFGSDMFVVMIDELYSIDGNEMVESIKNKPDLFEESISKHFKDVNIDRVLIGLGNFYKGKEGPILAYEEARRAVNLGLSLNQERKIYHIDDLGMVATLAGGNKKWQDSYVKRTLHRIITDDYLMETLEGFFANNMSLTQTAKKLKIHRNTLLYRLDKIKKMTGLDPRLFNDAMELKVALILNKLLNIENIPIKQ